MIKWLLAGALLVCLFSCNPRLSNGLRKKDLHKDVEMITTKGCPGAASSFPTPPPCTRTISLLLVKKAIMIVSYFISVSFNGIFMIQGKERSLTVNGAAILGRPLSQGAPAVHGLYRFRPNSAGLFHKKGALAAARNGDDVNPA